MFKKIPRVPHLYRNEFGVFYLRQLASKAEQEQLGLKRETWRSTHTKDAKVARGHALRFVLEKTNTMPILPTKNILTDSSSSLRVFPDGSIDFDPDKPKELAFAMQYLENNTTKSSPPNPEMKRRTEAAAQRMEDAQRQHERDLHQDFLRMERENEAHRASLASHQPTSPLLSKYIDAYLTLINKSDLYERTKKGYTAKLKVFQNFVGKAAKLADITPDKFLDFQTWLAKDDPLTLRKAITSRSIDEYANVVSNVYKKVIKKLADNPIEGRLVSKKQRMKSNRKPFTPDELTQIFNPERLNALRNPADFFVPLLGLLTGSRPASLCQLRLGDVRTDDGVLCFHYHDYVEGNSAKTEATNRIAPVHPLLVSTGFIRYLEDIRRLENSNATTLIFPWLNQYEQGYADVPTQNFTVALKALGLYVKNVKVFYSLRHTVNQRMKQKGVPEDWRSAYLGHENDSVNALTYGDEVPARVLFDKVIPALGFEEIEWDKIQYPRNNIQTLLNLVDIAMRRDARKAKRKALEGEVSVD